MNQQSIRKLRRKFSLAAFLSFMSIMLLMGGMIFAFNLYTTNKQIHATLDYIIANDGDISEANHTARSIEDFSAQNDFERFFEEIFSTGLDNSPELRFWTRYFSVRISVENDDIIWKNTGSIAAVTSEQAENYAVQALMSGKYFGTIDQFTYQISESEDSILIVFVDCKQQNAVIRRLMSIILGLIAVGAVGMLILVMVLSKYMIKPEILSAERQKQFITNAGHELKTPLAVIRANTELDIMLNGENEWNQSTLRQTEQMTKLIQDLVMIARAEESPQTENFIEVDVSASVREAVESLLPLAQQAEKNLTADMEDGIVMKAQEGQIKQLASLLIDNAIKYCDDKGTIHVSLSKKGKNIRLTVDNDYKDGANVDCSRFFERFYRAEESHGGEKTGYGIGLSIAESIVKRYKGTIHASWNNGIIRFTCKLTA